MLNRFRPTVAEINLENLVYNYNQINKRTSNKSVIPVVKADGYGHGVIQVVNRLYNEGVKYVAVSLIEEALEIREHFDDIDILVFGTIDVEQLELLSKTKITFSIGDVNLLAAVERSSIPLRFHIKIDTGMNRLGFKTIQPIISFMEKMNNNKINKNLYLGGVYTHLATADSNEEFALAQIAKFKSILDRLPYKPKMIHISNSSSAIKFEKELEFTTHVRLGIMLYGLSLEDCTSFLRPVMTLKTKINYIKTLKAGECVSYNITYKAQKNETIAIIPIGYADGFLRKNQGGYVSINDKKYEIIGRVCMDLTIVRIDETVRKQDDVILMGNDIITIDDVAKRLETINYEVVCLISKRVPRIYI